MEKLLDHKKGVLMLYKHHLKGSVITRLNKGYMSIYYIKVGDPYNEESGDFTRTEYFFSLFHKAAENSYPVMLSINNTTRLLIFDRKV